MIQEYQVSGFRVREYEELRSTNTEAERVGWDELEDKMVILRMFMYPDFHASMKSVHKNIRVNCGNQPIDFVGNWSYNTFSL